MTGVDFSVNNYIWKKYFAHIKWSELFLYTTYAFLTSAFVSYNSGEHRPKEIIIFGLTTSLGVAIAYWKNPSKFTFAGLEASLPSSSNLEGENSDSYTDLHKKLEMVSTRLADIEKIKETVNTPQANAEISELKEVINAEPIKETELLKEEAVTSIKPQ